jgi:thiol-disulfide isomerase/thioredoxin
VSDGLRLPRVRAPELPERLEWLNVQTPPTLADLRGRFVLLDFWTSSCVNCLHVLEDLAQLERLFPEELVVVGVHGAKYENEASLEAVRRAVLRHGVTHPVVHDPELRHWSEHAVRARPTLVLVDPEGHAITRHAGEHAFEPFAQLIGALLPVYRERGSLKPTAWRARPEAPPDEALRFPGKVLVHGDRLVVADSGRHRLVIADLDGAVREVVGSGVPGRADGDFEQAAFRYPQGLAARGDELFVADTDNHLLRRVDLSQRRVETVAGTGARSYVPRARGPAREVPLSSPWDLALQGDQLRVAHAGTHQVWSLDLSEGLLGALAGAGAEGREDGPLEEAHFAQPSGLAVAGDALFVADAESGAIRRVRAESDEVETLAGGDVFAFGYVDNVGEAARFQHPLGLAWARGRVHVADTGNHALRVVAPETREVETIIGLRRDEARRGDGCGEPGFIDGDCESARLCEPSGLSAWQDRLLFVADAGNHAVRVLDLDSQELATLQLRFPGA